MENICESGKKPAACKVVQAWERLWNHFFRHETHLIYDYLTSDRAELELSHLPSAEEVKELSPNPCGWGSGMEDSAINGGVLLMMLSCQYNATKDPALVPVASEIFDGLAACAEVHGVPGFVARSICLADRRSVYINSSRDQYTHFIHGLWYFYCSELSSAEQKAKIRKLFQEVACYFERCITPENNYALLRMDGSIDPTDLCRMINVCPHEAARLPMVYAAAWAVTGDKHWEDLYLRYAPGAVKHSADPDPDLNSTYPIFQMQCSLDLILQADKLHPEITEPVKKILQMNVERAEELLPAVRAQRDESDPYLLYSDWRSRSINTFFGYRVPQWLPEELKNLRGLREVGECAMIQLLGPEHKISDACRELLDETLLKTDFSRTTCAYILNVIAAYRMAETYHC